ncbi:MAG: Fic family protein [Candidatus Kapaibacteriales bacterium]
MSGWIYQNNQWPNFTWDEGKLSEKLKNFYIVLGKYDAFLQEDKNKPEPEFLDAISNSVIYSSAIEGVKLEYNSIKKSIVSEFEVVYDVNKKGKHLSKTPTDKLAIISHDIYSGIAELTKEKLCYWHELLIPEGTKDVEIGEYRTDLEGRMRVISGIGKKFKVHFEAPMASELEEEMNAFLNWFNSYKNNSVLDSLIFSGIAHFWFVTIHPFDDGNGRLARYIGDLALMGLNLDSGFLSPSKQIYNSRNEYYDLLEATQKGDLDLTPWLLWYIDICLEAINHKMDSLSKVSNVKRIKEKANKLYLNKRQTKIINFLANKALRVSSSKYATICKCSQDTALRDLRDLIDKKLIMESESGGRSKFYYLYENKANN